MSKLIKPEDAGAFQSARKFRKEVFRLEATASGKQGVRADSAPTRENENPSEPWSPEALPVKAQGLVEDPKKKAEQIVSEAEERARETIREAKERADDIFRQARERGRADGAEEVREKVERQRQASSQMLASFIERMKEREAKLVESLTPRLADLAAELAQKIIHKEVRKDSSLAKTQAEHAIAKILQREKIIIRVNRDDEELMKEHKPMLLKMFDGIDKIEVVADPDVERGGCIVETDLVKVDARPASQLRTARATILGEEER